MRFLRAVRQGRLLDDELTRAFLTPQVLHHVVDDGTEVHDGFGLEFVVVDGVVRSYDKEGVNTGASAYVEHHPEPDVDVAIVAATAGGAWKPRAAVTELVGSAG